MINPCMCPVEGYCPLYHRPMWGNFHRVCKGIPPSDDRETRESFLENRAQTLAQWSRERDINISQQNRTKTCRFFGEEKGVRECGSCRGEKKFVKTYECFHPKHTETTLDECRRCPEYDSHVLPSIGGIPDRFDASDHLGLSFSSAAKTALYNTRDKSVDLKGSYQGLTAYFLGGGPSLLDNDLSLLSGRLTVGVNNVSEVYPDPTIWTCVDPPTLFKGAPWDRPQTLKLVPRGLMGVDRGDGRRVFQSINTLYFLRDGHFQVRDFLTRRTFNWGSDADIGGGRSVMLTTLKLLWWLGVSRVVLLGCDFYMTAERPYAHSAVKDQKGCDSNNRKFEQLNQRLSNLRPLFEDAGMTVVNVNPLSGLTAFDYVPLTETF